MMRKGILILLMCVFGLTAKSQNVGISSNILYVPTERLDVDGNLKVSGTVGIGVTGAPSHKLHVVGGIRTTSGFIANDGTANTPSYRFESGGSMGIFKASANILGFSTNSLERMRIDASGNVGIGSTNPTFKLHVPSGYIGTDYINTTDNVVGSGVSGIMVKAGDNYFRTGNSSAVATFLNSSISPSYANLTGIPVRSSWSGVHRNFVAEQLSWKNYGNGHTIFDASQGTSPDGTSVNNTNPQYNWVATYPTLMGWNGSNTYGLRVDVARYAESAPGDNLGNHTATTTLNMNGNVINNFRRIEPLGIGGNSGEGANAYAIFQEGGAWTWPYPDLRIAYHTGIKLGANSSYNGIRFYTDYDMTSLVMSVNDASTGGTSNVYMTGSLGIRTAPSVPLDILGAGVAGNGTYRTRFGWYVGSEPLVSPSVGNWGYVGSSGEYYYNMYSRHYYAANGYYYFSDLSLKENVKDITNSLEKIISIRGVTYDIKKDSYYYNKKDIDSNNDRIGFIAQEIQSIFPSIISEIEDYNKNKILSVEYTLLVPVLVEAIKEQQKMIDDLKFKINTLMGE